jgi:putative transposase
MTEVFFDPQNKMRVYYINTRCLRPDWFSLGLEYVWSIMTEQLYFISRAYGIKIYAFSLEEGECHLLIAADPKILSEAMGWFMRETSRTLTRAAGRINQGYGRRFHRCLLTNQHQLRSAFKFVHYKVIDPSTGEKILNYKFTTLPGLLGFAPQLIPTHNLFLDDNHIDQTLRWIEEKPEPRNWIAVSRALRKKVFKLGRLNGRVHPMESDSL